MKRMDDEEDCSQSLTYRAVERHSIFIPSRAQMQWLMRVLLWSALCGVLGFIAGVHRSNQAETVASVQLRTFELNSTFIEAPSPESDAAWASLIPSGRGFIVIDPSGNPIRYSGSKAELSAVRSVALFHQIHCLNELRIGYYAAHHPSSPEQHSDGRHGAHRHSAAHMKHCFDYLRQTFMCMTDTTLETLQSGENGQLASVDGWGSTHKCGNFEEVLHWTARHRASESRGIL